MSEPVLFILIRHDMASMTRGRAAAQASHVANHFVYELENSGNAFEDVTKTEILYATWKYETTQGFGTVHVMGVDGNQLHQATKIAYENGLYSGITIDPTYPVKDGRVVHLVPVEVGGFIFGNKDDVQPLLENLEIGFLD